MKTTRKVSASPLGLSRVVGLTACCAGILLAGCNKGPAKPDDMPDLTACTVTVTYKGEPVSEASVLFAPKSGKYSAAGTTDASGKTVMKTDGKYDGVAAGEYQVSITKKEKLESDLGETPEDPAQLAEYEKKLRAQPAPKHLIPEKYSSFGTSGLAVTITDGTAAEETFELTD